MAKDEITQEDIVITISSGYESGKKYTSTDNITNLTGIGDDIMTVLQDHIVELILYYEKKLMES